MSKKSQSMSINTIIIATLGVAVLVVLFYIFTGKLGGFTKTIDQTDTCAQKCTVLNMDKSVGLDTETSQCEQGEQKIAGSYSDGKFGCCCKQRLA